MPRATKRTTKATAQAAALKAREEEEAAAAAAERMQHDKFMSIVLAKPPPDGAAEDPLFTLDSHRDTKKRITSNILTKYERANAIGTRAREIRLNFPVHVDVAGMEDEVAMARKELYAGKCPLIVRRYLPDHTVEIPHYEDWPVAELSLRAK